MGSQQQASPGFRHQERAPTNMLGLSKEEVGKRLSHLAHVIKETTIYLTTLTFSLMAIFSAATFCFLVPLVIEPAVSTLQHQFLETSCTTISGEWMEGKNKCNWSSCREGCTKEIFQCWKIKVVYTPNTTGQQDNVEGNLYPNANGCGYPPRVVCDDFAENYGQAESTFTCYYSQISPSVVITELDLQEVSATLMYSITIPCSIFSVSIIYLILAYIHIYPRKAESELDEKNSYLNVPKEETVEEEEEEEECLSDEEIRRKKHKKDIDEDRKKFRHQLYTEQNKFIDF